MGEGISFSPWKQCQSWEAAGATSMPEVEGSCGWGGVCTQYIYILYIYIIYILYIYICIIYICIIYICIDDWVHIHIYTCMCVWIYIYMSPGEFQIPNMDSCEMTLKASLEISLAQSAKWKVIGPNIWWQIVTKKHRQTLQTSTKTDHYTRGVPPEISQLCPVIPRMVMDQMQVSCSQVIRSLGQGSHLPDTHFFNGIKPGLHESSWWMDRITYMFVYIIIYICTHMNWNGRF